MSEEDVRAECLRLSLTMPVTREPMTARAAIFCGFVGDDPLHLKCLGFAVKSHGHLARVGSDRIIEEAKGYLAFVRPAPVQRAAEPKRRGRPRKNR